MSSNFADFCKRNKIPYTPCVPSVTDNRSKLRNIDDLPEWLREVKERQKRDSKFLIKMNFTVSSSREQIEGLKEIQQYIDKFDNEQPIDDLDERYEYFTRSDFEELYMKLLSSQLECSAITLKKGMLHNPYPYSVLLRRMDKLRNELIAEAMHPDRISYYLRTNQHLDLGECFAGL